MNKPRPNYKQLFSIQKKWETQLKQLCPQIDHRSGIYFWRREENDDVFMYIGQAKDLVNRSISHCMGYQQRLDLSIRKWGFYGKDNEMGWRLKVVFVPMNKLDEMEQYYIEQYKQQNVTLYNIESGGSTGKTIINERKGPRTYTEGVAYGKKRLARDLKDIIDKHLIVKPKKDGKLDQNALAKFNKLLDDNSK